ncbi:MAG: hypothetical protein WHT46_00525 [Candidatus Geothermincolales bacterium]
MEMKKTKGSGIKRKVWLVTLILSMLLALETGVFWGGHRSATASPAQGEAEMSATNTQGPKVLRDKPVVAIVKSDIGRPYTSPTFREALADANAVDCIVAKLNRLSDELKENWPGYPGIRVRVMLYSGATDKPHSFEEAKRVFLEKVVSTLREENGIKRVIRETPEEMWIGYPEKWLSNGKLLFVLRNFLGQKPPHEDCAKDDWGNIEYTPVNDIGIDFTMNDLSYYLYEGVKVEFSLGHNLSATGPYIASKPSLSIRIERPFLSFNLNGCGVGTPTIFDRNGNAAYLVHFLNGAYVFANGAEIDDYMGFYQVTQALGFREQNLRVFEDCALVGTGMAFGFDTSVAEGTIIESFLSPLADPYNPIVKNERIGNVVTRIHRNGWANTHEWTEVDELAKPFVWENPIYEIKNELSDTIPEEHTSGDWFRIYVATNKRPSDGYYVLENTKLIHYLYHVPELRGKGEEVEEKVYEGTDKAFLDKYSSIRLDSSTAKNFFTSVSQVYANGKDAFYIRFEPIVLIGNKIYDMTMKEFFGVAGPSLTELRGGGSDTPSDAILRPSTNHTLRGNVDEYILVGNPNKDKRANVTLKLYNKYGYIGKTYRAIAPLTRTTVMINDLIAPEPGKTVLSRGDNIQDCEARSISVEIESDVPVIAERAMYFSPASALGAKDGTSSGASATPSKFHSFADGSGAWGWKTFYCIFNPNDAPTEIKFMFMPQRDNGQAKSWEETYTIPPKTRFTLLGKEGFDYSCVITTSLPTMAERAMYNIGGEASGGAAAEQSTKVWSRRWFFPDGYINRTEEHKFKTYLLLQNPTNTEATVDVYLFKDKLFYDAQNAKYGYKLEPPYFKVRYCTIKVPPKSRVTTNIPDPKYEPSPVGMTNFIGTPPPDKQFSLEIASNQPIVAEMSLVKCKPYTGVSMLSGICTKEDIVIPNLPPYTDGLSEDLAGNNILTKDNPVLLAEGANYGAGPGDPNYKINTYILILPTANREEGNEIQSKIDGKVKLRITFMKDDGGFVTKEIEALLNTRLTLTPDQMPWNCGFSTLIELVDVVSDVKSHTKEYLFSRTKIFVSRNMLFRYDNGSSGSAASNAIGLSEAKTKIFFAEGYTGL